MNNTMRYSAYASEYKPGKWLPEMTLTIGYDGSDEGRTFAWGEEVSVEFKLTEGEDGIYRVRSARIGHASGGHDIDGTLRYAKLLQEAAHVANIVQNMTGEQLHGVGPALNPRQAMGFAMAFRGIEKVNA